MFKLNEIQPFTFESGDWRQAAMEACARLHELRPAITRAMEFGESEKEELIKTTYDGGIAEWMIKKVTEARNHLRRLLNEYICICENAYLVSKDADEKKEIVMLQREYQGMIDTRVRIALEAVVKYALANHQSIIEIVETPFAPLTIQKQFRLVHTPK